MKKRILSLALVLVLALAFIPFTPSALASNTISLLYAPAFDWEETKPFKEGISFVKQDGLWGAVNTRMETVIPFQYEDVDAFSEGLIAVKQRGTWGYIDNAGRTVIASAYQQAGPFSEGLAAVQMVGGAWGYINRSGTMSISVRFIDDVSSNATARTVRLAGMFYEGEALVWQNHRLSNWLWENIYRIDKSGQSIYIRYGL